MFRLGSLINSRADSLNSIEGLGTKRPFVCASTFLVYKAASVEGTIVQSNGYVVRVGLASAARAPGSRATQPARPLIGDEQGGSFGQTVRTPEQLLMASILTHHFAYLEPQNSLRRRLVGT